MIHSHISLLRVISFGAAVTFAAALGSVALFVAQHRTSSSESADGASRVFQQLREQFAHQEPLLDMNERRPRPVTNGAIHPAPLHTVHTVIFDRRGGDRLVRMDMPYWLARKYAVHGHQWLGQLSFLDDTEFDPEPITLSWSDVERHGPGLIADYRHPGGGQFISWVD